VALVAQRRVPVVLMHMRGEPATMHQHTDYDCVVLDVYDELAARIAACRAAGIAAENIAIDPGLGFAKTSDQNAALLRGLSLFLGFGLPLLVGASRKGLVRAVKQTAPPEERLPASLAAAMIALDQGAGILRVHDVGETAQAIAVWRALRGAA
jgi:dihydropteroate synthase